jgi:hypothetical protein
MKSSQIQVVFAGVISCDVAEAISLVSFSSTSSPPFFNVPMTLLNAEKAAARESVHFAPVSAEGRR